MRLSSIFRSFFFFTCFSLATPMMFAVGEGGRIDMVVSPIRDEFTVSTTGATNRSVQYTNNSNVPYVIYMTVEDCQPSGNYGTPICKVASGSGVNPEFSSTWIKLSETNFTVPPHSSKVIQYTVNVPAGAAPGGHYGAIFFNNPDGNTTTPNAVGMIRRIGMLYMMNIPGQVVVNPSIGDILVDGPGGIGEQPLTPIKDNPLFNIPMLQSAPDFVKDALRNWTPLWGEMKNELNPFWEKPTLTDTPFSVALKIPVRNDGNIHIRPTGKIYLYDENGTQLTQIGKESIIDENGIFVGEKITDYLPINNEQGNVLPNTERTFEIDWQGFAYKESNPMNGKDEIKFETPGVYYSRLTDQDTRFIYPWERLSLRKVQKTLHAKVEFSYRDITTGQDVMKTMDVPVTIVYYYITKTLNYGMIFLIGFIILCAWYFIGRRDRRIDTLEHEKHDLTDEIAVLEAAQKSMKAKTKKKAIVAPLVEKAPPTKTTAKKVATTKKDTPIGVATKKKKEEEKTVNKSVKPVVKKPVTRTRKAPPTE